MRQPKPTHRHMYSQRKTPHVRQIHVIPQAIDGEHRGDSAIDLHPHCWKSVPGFRRECLWKHDIHTYILYIYIHAFYIYIY